MHVVNTWSRQAQTAVCCYRDKNDGQRPTARDQARGRHTFGFQRLPPTATTRQLKQPAQDWGAGGETDANTNTRKHLWHIPLSRLHTWGAVLLPPKPPPPQPPARESPPVPAVGTPPDGTPVDADVDGGYSVAAGTAGVIETPLLLPLAVACRCSPGLGLPQTLETGRSLDDACRVRGGEDYG